MAITLAEILYGLDFLSEREAAEILDCETLLRDPSLVYTTHMKRTNLVLDAELLDRATRLLGVKTYSAAVNLALAEVLRLRKIQSLPQYFGQGLWQGDLQEMREDRVEGRRQGKSPRRGRR